MPPAGTWLNPSWTLRLSYNMTEQAKQTAQQDATAELAYDPNNGDGDTLKPSGLSRRRSHSSIPTHVCLNMFMCRRAQTQIACAAYFRPLAHLNPSQSTNQVIDPPHANPAMFICRLPSALNSTL